MSPDPLPVMDCTRGYDLLPFGFTFTLTSTALHATKTTDRKYQTKKKSLAFIHLCNGCACVNGCILLEIRPCVNACMNGMHTAQLALIVCRREYT